MAFNGLSLRKNKTKRRQTSKRRGAFRASFNKSPDYYFCPVCGSQNISLDSSDMWSNHYTCRSCSCAFSALDDLAYDEYKDESEYLTGAVGIDWDRCTNPLEIVRLLTKKHENVPAIIDDPEVIVWIDNYWSFVTWNEHGNEASYEELYQDNGYRSILIEIQSYPQDLVDYISAEEDRDNWNSEQTDLIDRLMKIHGRVSR